MNREEGNFVHNQQVEINLQEDQKSDTSMIYSDRQSISFISKSKGGLLQNPDGTLQIMKPVQASDYKKIKDNLNYGINSDQDDNLSQDTSQLSLMSLPQNQVLLPLYSSPAHPFFIPLGSLPQFVDQFIDLYIRHNICFLLFLVVQLAVEGVFQYLTYKFREKTIKEVQYNDILLKSDCLCVLQILITSASLIIITSPMIQVLQIDPNKGQIVIYARF
ncbi:hypothetical protein ABPG72_004053 [Tetrahymena utriculariae]